MAGFRWGWFKPLAVAAVLTMVASTQIRVVAQTSTSAHTDSVPHNGGSAANEASQANSTRFASLPGDAAASASTATITGTEIESLPFNGRRWEELVLGAPRDSAQSNGAPPSLTLSGQESADVSVDGLSLRSAFGSTSASSSGSPSQSSTQQGAAEPSGMGQAWSSGRGAVLSEAAVNDVQTVSGVDNDSSVRASGRTNIQTRSGGDALHGQVFVFNRQHGLAAQNPSANWVQQTAPATYSAVPVFTAIPYTPPDREFRWGFGLGSKIRPKQIYWFAALDGYGRNYTGVSSVKWPDRFFSPHSNDQVQLLGAQLGTNNTNALAKYSQMLQTMDGLFGPVTRAAKQYSGFARVDWRLAERHHFTVEGTGADWNAPGSGFTRVSENHGNHSFGSSQPAMDARSMGGFRHAKPVSCNSVFICTIDRGRSPRNAIRIRADSQSERLGTAAANCRRFPRRLHHREPRTVRPGQLSRRTHRTRAAIFRLDSRQPACQSGGKLQPQSRQHYTAP